MFSDTPGVFKICVSKNGDNDILKLRGSREEGMKGILAVRVALKWAGTDDYKLVFSFFSRIGILFVQALQNSENGRYDILAASTDPVTGWIHGPSGILTVSMQFHELLSASQPFHGWLRLSNTAVSDNLLQWALLAFCSVIVLFESNFPLSSTNSLGRRTTVIHMSPVQGSFLDC